MRRIITGISFMLFCLIIHAQSMKTELNNLTPIFVNDALSLKVIDSIKINNVSSNNYISIIDSVRKVHVFLDLKNSLILNGKYCLSDCDLIGFGIFDSSGNYLADWSFYYEGAMFNNLLYYYPNNGKPKEIRLIIGCPKSGKCKWYKFSKTLFSGNTLDKSVFEFNAMMEQIINNKNTFKRKAKKTSIIRTVYH